MYQPQLATQFLNYFVPAGIDVAHHVNRLLVVRSSAALQLSPRGGSQCLSNIVKIVGRLLMHGKPVELHRLHRLQSLPRLPPLRYLLS